MHLSLLLLRSSLSSISSCLYLVLACLSLSPGAAYCLAAADSPTQAQAAGGCSRCCKRCAPASSSRERAGSSMGSRGGAGGCGASRKGCQGATEGGSQRVHPAAALCALRFPHLHAAGKSPAAAAAVALPTFPLPVLSCFGASTHTQIAGTAFWLQLLPGCGPSACWLPSQAATPLLLLPLQLLLCHLQTRAALSGSCLQAQKGPAKQEDFGKKELMDLTEASGLSAKSIYGEGVFACDTLLVGSCVVCTACLPACCA